jgi:hypothetical protein
MERPLHPKRLVIGIGNPLRGDDGVGALLQPLAPARASSADSHHLDPAALLAGVEVEALRFAFPVVMAGHDRRPRTSRFALPAAA